MSSNTITATGLRLLIQTLLCFATGLPTWFPDYFRLVIWLFLATSDEPVFKLVSDLYHKLQAPCEITTTVSSSTVTLDHDVNQKPKRPVDEIPIYIATPPIAGSSATKRFPGEKHYPVDKHNPGEKSLTSEKHYPGEKPVTGEKHYPGEKPVTGEKPLQGDKSLSDDKHFPGEKYYPGEKPVTGDKAVGKTGAWWGEDDTEGSTADATIEPASRKTAAKSSPAVVSRPAALKKQAVPRESVFKKIGKTGKTTSYMPEESATGNGDTAVSNDKTSAEDRAVAEPMATAPPPEVTEPQTGLESKA